METPVNAIKLHYEEYGQGPAVLLIHGFPLNGAMWQPQVVTLTDPQTATQRRIIVPDLRGFGASPVPPGPYAMDDFATDLVALLDMLQIDKVVLGGLSMGGYIAFAFMRRYAQRVRALILADTRPGPDSPEARETREINAQIAEQQGMGALADKLLPGLLAPNADPTVSAILRDMMIHNQPQGVAAALRGMAQRPDSRDLLAQIAVPTLIIVGAQDSLTPPDVAHAMRAAIPGSRLAEIPFAGHMSNMEQPDAFNAVLMEFLGELDT